MIDDPYSEFKSRVSIQDLLIDAGYQLNRRDGIRYPSYVRTDEEGRRVHGDKFLVTANGMCCFQPPVKKCFNVISFIKEHPEKFRDYTPGMNLDRLVFLVCNRLLDIPVESRQTRIINPSRDLPTFKMEDYRIKRFDRNDWDTQKPFYPFFKARGIDSRTQAAFAEHFVIAERTAQDGKKYRNLSFPMTIPGKDKVVGFEERGMKRSDGSSYKGMAKGTNASEGLWQASPSGTKLNEAKRVFIFESAYDAMAFYQILAGKDSNLTAKERQELKESVFASTGGNPATMQMRGLLREAKQATFHLGFDTDEAGEKFTEQFKTMAAEEKIDSGRIVRERPYEGYKDFNDELLGSLEKKMSPPAPDSVPEAFRDYVASFDKNTQRTSSNFFVLSPTEEQVDLLPKAFQKLYSRYESLYDDAYEKKRSSLVTPEDKQDAISKAIEAKKVFQKELAKALGIRDDECRTELTDDDAEEERKIQHDVDYTTHIDDEGNVDIEVETSDQEERHHGMRR